MKKSILLISLAVLPLFGYSQNVLPDWALGGFVRPEKANPIITPNPSNQFDCPMQDKKIGWEESDVFNPAATVKAVKYMSFTGLRTILQQESANVLRVSD